MPKDGSLAHKGAPNDQPALPHYRSANVHREVTLYGGCSIDVANTYVVALNYCSPYGLLGAFGMSSLAQHGINILLAGMNVCAVR